MPNQPKQLTNIIINGENYLVSDETVQTLLEVIWNNNGAISSRINDLNQRILTNTDDIENNAYVTAIALNDLNDRINNSSLDLDSLEIAYENLKSYVLSTYNNINTSYNRLYSYTTVQLGTLNTGYNNLKSYILTTYNNVKTSYDTLNSTVANSYSYLLNAYLAFYEEYDRDSYLMTKLFIQLHENIEDLNNNTLPLTYASYLNSLRTDVDDKIPNSYKSALDNCFNDKLSIVDYNNDSYVIIKSLFDLNDKYAYVYDKYSYLYDEYDTDMYVLANSLIDLDSRTKELHDYVEDSTYVITNSLIDLDTRNYEIIDTHNALKTYTTDKIGILNTGYTNLETYTTTQIGTLNTGYSNLESYILLTYNNVKSSYDTLNNTVASLKTSYGQLYTYSTTQIGTLNTGYSNLESYVLTSYNNIKISYDTLASRVNTMQGLYIPLAGNSTSNYVSGTINFYDNTGRDIIKINSVDKKTYIWNIVGNAGSWNNQYGFSQLYDGTQSANNNSLILWAHNQAGTHQKVRTILQDGTITVHTLTTFGAQIKSTLATGTMPLNVTSTTLNTNLNADMLDDKHASYFIDLINENANDIEEYSYVTAVVLNDLNDRLIDSYDYAINSYTYAINNIDYLTANSIPIAKAKIFGTTSQLLSYSFDIDDYGYDDDKSYLVKCVSSSPLALSVVDSYIHVSYVVNDSLWYWDRITLYPMSELFEVVQRNAYVTSIALSDLNRRVLLLEEQLLNVLSYNNSTLSNNYGMARTKRKITEVL